MSFILYADKTQLTVRKREPITSGSANTYDVQFGFSKDWDGLDKTALFRAGSDGDIVSVILDVDGGCIIPWEVLAKPKIRLKCGVYGTRSGDTILPTIWADMGEILSGANIDLDAPPTPDIYSQILGAANKAVETANSVRKDAESGKFKGDQGPQGPAGSGANFTAGDGMTLSGSTLNVTTPTRGIFTQAEFDALPEEQRNKGMYIVDDGQSAVIDGAGEIYSTEEVRIGTWVDGKPLYRKVMSGKLPTALAPNSLATTTIPVGELKIETVVDVRATALRSASAVKGILPFLVFTPSSGRLTNYGIYASPANISFQAWNYGNGYGTNWDNADVTVTIKYTKTTDSEGTP